MSKQFRIDDIDEEYLAEFLAVAKVMGEKNAREYLAKTDEELKEAMVVCHMHIAEATNKTNVNLAFREAKGIVSDFQRALRETTVPLKKTAALCGAVLQNRKESR